MENIHKEKETKNKDEESVGNKNVSNGNEEYFQLFHKNYGLSKERTGKSEMQQSKPSELKHEIKRSKESKGEEKTMRKDGTVGKGHIGHEKGKRELPWIYKER